MKENTPESFKVDFKRNPEDKHDKIDRIWNLEDATSILDKIQKMEVAEITETKKRSPQAANKLYDLTSLQREANRLHHFPASRTLQLAQSLYERHKAITYPRTDSKALPEDYGPIQQLLEILLVLWLLMPKGIRKVGSTKKQKIFNNKQISDHFAIIPTNTPPSGLDPNETKIYQLITKRFIAAFYLLHNGMLRQRQ